MFLRHFNNILFANNIFLSLIGGILLSPVHSFFLNVLGNIFHSLVNKTS